MRDESCSDQRNSDDLRSTRRAVTGLAIVFAALSQAHADTLRVPSQYPNIRAAVDAASPGDEILLADGVFSGAGNRNVVFPPIALTLRSESGEACVIDAEGLGRALVAEGRSSRFLESRSAMGSPKASMEGAPC